MNSIKSSSDSFSSSSPFTPAESAVVVEQPVNPPAVKAQVVPIDDSKGELLRLAETTETRYDDGSPILIVVPGENPKEASIALLDFVNGRGPTPPPNGWPTTRPGERWHPRGGLWVACAPMRFLIATISAVRTNMAKLENAVRAALIPHFADRAIVFSPAFAREILADRIVFRDTGVRRIEIRSLTAISVDGFGYYVHVPADLTALWLDVCQNPHACEERITSLRQRYGPRVVDEPSEMSVNCAIDMLEIVGNPFELIDPSTLVVRDVEKAPDPPEPPARKAAPEGEPPEPPSADPAAAGHAQPDQPGDKPIEDVIAAEIGSPVPVTLVPDVPNKDEPSSSGPSLVFKQVPWMPSDGTPDPNAKPDETTTPPTTPTTNENESDEPEKPAQTPEFEAEMIVVPAEITESVSIVGLTTIISRVYVGTRPVDYLASTRTPWVVIPLNRTVPYPACLNMLYTKPDDLIAFKIHVGYKGTLSQLRAQHRTHLIMQHCDQKDEPFIPPPPEDNVPADLTAGEQLTIASNGGITVFIVSVLTVGLFVFAFFAAPLATLAGLATRLLLK